MLSHRLHPCGCAGTRLDHRPFECPFLPPTTVKFQPPTTQFVNATASTPSVLSECRIYMFICRYHLICRLVVLLWLQIMIHECCLICNSRCFRADSTSRSARRVRCLLLLERRRSCWEEERSSQDHRFPLLTSVSLSPRLAKQLLTWLHHLKYDNRRLAN